MCTRGILRSVVPPATNKPVVLRASGANSILTELSNEAVALSIDDAVRLNSCAVARRCISAVSMSTSRSKISFS